MINTHDRRISMPGSFVQGLPLSIRLHPVRSTVILVLLYVAFCSLWIWLSGLVAAREAADLAALRRIELVKGLACVLLTAAGFGGVCHWHLRIIAGQEQQLMEQERSLAAAERQAMAGIFAASTCHDANNVLQVVRGSVEMASLETAVTPAMRTMLTQAMDGCTRVTQMFTTLITLSRQSLPGGPEEFDVVTLLKRIVGMAKRHQVLRRHSIALTTPGYLAMWGNPQLLSRTLLNLLLNAGEAMTASGTIRVDASAGATDVVIDVHDSGPGIADEEKDRITRAFYTTKETGTGLGLLSLTACAREHGGSFEILDSPLGGAQFRLRLPVARTVPDAAAASDGALA